MSFRSRSETKSAQNAEIQVKGNGSYQYGREIVSGTKYAHIGGKRTGLASTMDTELVQRNLENELAAYGDGAYQFQMLNPDKTVKKNATIKIGNRIFKSRNDGTFNVIDESYLKKIEQDRLEHEEYIKGVMRKAVTSDEALAHILGVGVNYARRLCAPGGIQDKGLYEQVFGATRREIGDESDLDKFNCTPGYLHALNENSTQFAGSISKLKAIVAAFSPILEDMAQNTAEKAREHMDEKTTKEFRKEIESKRDVAPGAAASSAAGDQ